MAGKLVCGVGVNDADYPVAIYERVGGKNKKTNICPYYMTWKSMIDRCYAPSQIKKAPRYIDCFVCDEWLTFSNFKSWMKEQNWKCRQLDKDILVKGNKIYSPNNCAFVTNKINTFVIERDAMRGLYMLGVDFDKTSKKFRARCKNPFSGKKDFLGYFNDEISAHLAWKSAKHQFACRLADLQTNERVANALRRRYAD